jgi:hypothetical protein
VFGNRTRRERKPRQLAESASEDHVCPRKEHLYSFVRAFAAFQLASKRCGTPGGRIVR